MMDKLHFGETVLLNFPFTDGISFKPRPALIINDFADGDIIVCRITSKIYNSNYDVEIDDWGKSGLKLPSIIRVHKIATLEKSLVKIKLGQISSEIQEMVKNTLQILHETI